MTLSLIKMFSLLGLLGFCVTACEVQMRGDGPVFTETPEAVVMPRQDLSQLKYIQCYSEDLVVNFDLGLEDLSRLPRFPSIPADIVFKDSSLDHRFKKVRLGFAEHGYFFDASPTPGYVLQQSYNRGQSHYAFEIKLVNSESVLGTANLSLVDGAWQQTLRSTLTCSISLH